MELSPKELKLQSSDTLEGGGVLLRWGSARWPGREQKIAYTAAQGRFSEKGGNKATEAAEEWHNLR